VSLPDKAVEAFATLLTLYGHERIGAADPAALDIPVGEGSHAM